MKTIEFKIINEKNPDIYQSGYAEIKEDEIDYYYYDSQGFAISRPFTHHNGVNVHPTDEQNDEIDQFNELVGEEWYFIEDILFNAVEGENKEYSHCGILLKIGDE